ncbi:hypothetical protein ACJX0J_040223, partial [Zea mays]
NMFLLVAPTGTKEGTLIPIPIYIFFEDFKYLIMEKLSLDIYFIVCMLWTDSGYLYGHVTMKEFQIQHSNITTIIHKLAQNCRELLLKIHDNYTKNYYH